MTVNKVTLIGNLGRDAEIRNTASGMVVATLRLATADRKKGPDGSWQDHTEWHSVVCFDKLASLMERFGKKGKQLYIDGKLQTREYTDKDGNKRWSTEVVANDVRLLGGARDGDAEAAPPRGGAPDRGTSAAQTRSAPPRQATKPAPPADDYGAGGDDYEIPF